MEEEIGGRWGRLYDETETMYGLLRSLLPDNPEVEALIKRIEYGPELTIEEMKGRCLDD